MSSNIVSRFRNEHGGEALMKAIVDIADSAKLHDPIISVYEEVKGVMENLKPLNWIANGINGKDQVAIRMMTDIVENRKNKGEWSSYVK